VATAGEALQINLDAIVTVGGHVSYVESRTRFRRHAPRIVARLRIV